MCDCQSAALSETLQEEMLLVLEDKLGLAELHREAFESFIETIFKQTNRVWIAVGIAGGLLAVLIISVVAMALALAS